MKKFITLLLCVLLTFTLHRTAFAIDNEEFKTVNANKEEIIEYGKEFVSEIIATRNDTNWNDNTKMDEIIETVDTNGNLNGLIINLKTDGNNTGYLVIEAFNNESLSISEFGYEGEYYITRDHIKANSIDKDIVYLGNRNFFIENGGKLYNLNEFSNTDDMAIDIAVLEEEYVKQIDINKNEQLQNIKFIFIKG